MKRLCCPGLVTLLALALALSLGGLASGAQADRPDAGRRPVEFRTPPSDRPPLEIATDYLAQERARARSAAAADDEWSVESLHASGGTTHVVFRQRVAGLRVWNGQFGVSVDVRGRVLSAHDGFADAPWLAPEPIRGLTPRQAVEHAAEALGLPLPPTFAVLEEQDWPPRVVLAGDGRLSRDPIPVERMYMRVEAALRPIWHLVIREPDESHWWELAVDAETGALHARVDWVSRDSYLVFPPPLASPADGARVVVADPADPVASPFGWHDIDGVAGPEYTDTRGNNVFAQLDVGGLPESRPSGGASLDFASPLDLDLGPSANREAAIENVFYLANWLHDAFYHYGFDEAAGNFQRSNYGAGGLGSDEVLADVQDDSFSDNAQFSSPPDGQNGELELALFASTASTVSVDSPISSATQYAAKGAAFGPPIAGSPVSGEVVLAFDAVEGPENSATDGCSPLDNAQTVAGRIALIDRGDCLFVEKVANAQAAGAIAVIVVNNVPGVISLMAGEDPTLTIPSVFMTREDGQQLRSLIFRGLTVTLDAVSDLRDSAFDSAIVIHEYGHGVSMRLTGGPFNAACLNSRQSAAMGEGWSDFWALAFTTTPDDLGVAPRPFSTWVQAEPAGGFGLRNFRYSTDLAIDPQTYADLSETNLPHGGGEIWAAALWDLYWILIDEYGFDPDVATGEGGNNLAVQLSIDALKIQPCNPSFLDGRDALLAADLAAGAESRCAIWEAFARRGMGVGADDGGSASSIEPVESFEQPAFCLPEPGSVLLQLAALGALAGVARRGAR